MAKPPKTPEKKPDTDEFILRVLVQILEATVRQNLILRNTERNNERRHRELLKALQPSEKKNISFVIGEPQLK